MTEEEARARLDEYRILIDDVDRRIVALLNERTTVVENIGRVKREAKLPVYEPKREDQVFANISSANHGPLTDHSLRGIFERIIDEMRSIQRQRMIQTPPQGTEMLVVMQQGATEEQIEHVIDRLVDLGFDVHRSTGQIHTVLGGVGGKYDFDLAVFQVMEGVKEAHRIVSPYKLASRNFRPQGTVVQIGSVAIGGDAVVVMAGPCSLENREQIEECAELAARTGARVMRGGAFKPSSSPYEFQGLGAAGLQMLREAADHHGLLVVSEIVDQTQISLLSEFAHIIQVGARNMQNFNLLRELGKQAKPVLLKRGIAASIEELLLSAEHILAGGNYNVILCERGIRTFETYTRNTLDLSAIPVLKKLSHLPVVVDPSHGTGRRDIVAPMAKAALAAGADGLMIEVHPDPDRAVSDGAQSLRPEQFTELMLQLQTIAVAVNRTL